MLVDRLDSERPRAPRREAAQFVVLDADSALIALLDTADDPHERAFPGAVVTHQGEDLAGPEGKRHVRERANGTEELREPFTAHEVRARGAHARLGTEVRSVSRQVRW